MKKALQRLFLVSDEVKIVKKKNIYIFEFIAELANLFLLGSESKIVSKLLCGNVHGIETVIRGQVPDGMQQMCLAQPGAAINKKGIETVSHVFPDFEGSGVS